MAVTVAVASSYDSDLTPSHRPYSTSVCQGCFPKKTKKKCSMSHTHTHTHPSSQHRAWHTTEVQWICVKCLSPQLLGASPGVPEVTRSWGWAGGPLRPCGPDQPEELSISWKWGFMLLG